MVRGNPEERKDRNFGKGQHRRSREGMVYSEKRRWGGGGRITLFEYLILGKGRQVSKKTKKALTFPRVRLI